MHQINPRVIAISLVILTLILGGLATSNTETDSWYQNLIKSDLNPQGYVFGIVWPILYFLMGITIWRTYELIKNLFYIQLILNLIWSWLFFSFHLTLIALINIWLLIFINVKILFMIFKKDKLAAFLHMPYIFWLLFASYLNLFIVFNN
tara:strand:- start:343 stop:789 length:447 start_codon:yes stop_codon:yes gene_type:complete